MGWLLYFAGVVLRICLLSARVCMSCDLLLFFGDACLFSVCWFGTMPHMCKASFSQT